MTINHVPEIYNFIHFIDIIQMVKIFLLIKYPRILFKTFIRHK